MPTSLEVPAYQRSLLISCVTQVNLLSAAAAIRRRVRELVAAGDVMYHNGLVQNPGEDADFLLAAPLPPTDPGDALSSAR